jgi:hypothetical protein
MALHPDWLEFLCLLRSHEVRFLVVGAHALAAHGAPRFTGDLDLLVERSAENAGRLLGALERFGFGGLGLTVRDFTRPSRVAQLGRPPVRIDILTSLSGVSFAAAWRGRVEAELGGVTIAVLGLAELRRNKRAAGRPKDLADLAALDELHAAARARAVEERAPPRRRPGR